MNIWIAIGVYVWINHDPAVTYDHSPGVATEAQCNTIVALQRERIAADADIIGFAVKCVELTVSAKPKGEAIAVPAKPPFQLNTHTPGFDFWGKLFHDA